MPRDMEIGQGASRAVPIPGPMVEQVARAAMADQGTRAAMVDPGTPWAVVGSPQKNVLGKIAARGSLWKRGRYRVLWRRVL